MYETNPTIQDNNLEMLFFHLNEVSPVPVTWEKREGSTPEELSSVVSETMDKEQAEDILNAITQQNQHNGLYAAVAESSSSKGQFRVVLANNQQLVGFYNYLISAQMEAPALIDAEAPSAPELEPTESEKEAVQSSGTFVSLEMLGAPKKYSDDEKALLCKKLAEMTSHNDWSFNKYTHRGQRFFESSQFLSSEEVKRIKPIVKSYGLDIEVKYIETFLYEDGTSKSRSQIFVKQNDNLERLLETAKKEETERKQIEKTSTMVPIPTFVSQHKEPQHKPTSTLVTSMPPVIPKQAQTTPIDEAMQKLKPKSTESISYELLMPTPKTEPKKQVEQAPTPLMQKCSNLNQKPKTPAQVKQEKEQLDRNVQQWAEQIYDAAHQAAVKNYDGNTKKAAKRVDPKNRTEAIAAIKSMGFNGFKTTLSGHTVNTQLLFQDVGEKLAKYFTTEEKKVGAGKTRIPTDGLARNVNDLIKNTISLNTSEIPLRK